MSEGITQATEILEAVDALAKCIAEAKKDGVINIWDAPKFAQFVLPAKKAVEGAENIVFELKDLDNSEIQELVNHAFTSMTALVSAVISAPQK